MGLSARGLRGRGPFHARLFYKVQAVACGILFEHWLDGGAYLRECELMDVTDEIRHRIRRRPKSAAASVTP
jgi:hypothetical protein